MSQQQYWLFDKETLIINQVALIAKQRAGQYQIPRYGLMSKPLEEKDGYQVCAVLDENGCAIDSEYVEDHRDKTIYNTQDCTQSKTVEKLGAVEDGWTLSKPENAMQKWLDVQWVDDEEKIAQYNAKTGKVIRDNAVSDDLNALDVGWDVVNDAADVRRVINDAETIGAQETDTTQFRLADNSWRETSLAELRQVLTIFIARKRSIWEQFATWDATDKLEAFKPEY
ncbi:MAG: hypothetical protein ACK5MF_13515 [Vibrio sp.]|uniref:hypothetical protein n=1 Tax=Vibrio sp. TaxID=678 RepID=UPI003A8A2B3E